MSYKTFDAEGNEVQPSPLHAPTDELRRKMLDGRVCGDCRYFSLREGQRLIEAQQFLAVLVKEHRWKPHHLGALPETLGDCGAYRSGSSSDDTTLTGPMHAACDQWRPR